MLQLALLRTNSIPRDGACLLMGWSGRAPAPPASEAGKGRQRRGARHVSDSQYRNRRDRHRYRQELVPRRGPRCARRHRAAAKVVAWPSGSAARQYTALPDRHGSLRRCTSPEPQTRIAWAHTSVVQETLRCGISTPPMSPWGQVRRQRRRARVFRFTPDCRHVDQRWISSVWARIGLVPFWPNMEARGSEASSRAGLLLVGYLASRCCVNHSVAGPAEASKSFT